MKSLDKTIKSDRVNLDEKKLIKLRKRVNELFFNHHLSKSMIAKKKKVARNFVIKWTRSPNQDFTRDNRGWPKGKRKKWVRSIKNQRRNWRNYSKIDCSNSSCI